MASSGDNIKIYSRLNVLERAIRRIEWLFDEFEEICVSFSGGKDSCVCFYLAYEIAKRRNRLPISVLWLDQEVEWQGTADIAEHIMTLPGVKPYWYQIPFVITNNASVFSRYSNCWEIGKESEWMREKHPLSIKENKYNEIRFHDLFKEISKVDFTSKRVAYLVGMRTEETPKRLLACTYSATYKGVTWGKALVKELDHYTFFPIYDWGYRDVWKAMHEHNWKYNAVYDEMYRLGVNISDMRISNLHHETAIQALLLVQEIEPKTWEKVSKRIEGANAIKHLKKGAFACPKTLPYMFDTWEDYAEHLIENIIQEDKNKREIRKRIAKEKPIYTHRRIRDRFFKEVINTVLSSDWDYTKLDNFKIRHEIYGYRQWKKGKPGAYSVYIDDEEVA